MSKQCPLCALRDQASELWSRAIEYQRFEAAEKAARVVEVLEPKQKERAEKENDEPYRR